jgi:hypothetical protein
MCASWLGTVISRIDAGVVTCLVYGTPIGSIDSPTVGCSPADWKGAGDFDPSVLESCNETNQGSKLTEILVLAENNRNIKVITVSTVQGIKCKAHIDSLFLTAQKGVIAESRDLECFVPVDQWATVNGDAATPHHCKFIGPESVPECIVRGRWNARVEVDALQHPPIGSAYGPSEFLHLKVRKCVAENAPGVMKQVLSIDISNSAFNGWFDRHEVPDNEITRLRPCGGSAG